MNEALFSMLSKTVSYQLKDLCGSTYETDDDTSIIEHALKLAGSDLQSKKRLKTEITELHSIFNHIHGANGQLVALVDKSGAFAGYGQTSNVNVLEQIRKWEKRSAEIPYTKEHVDALLESLEDCFSVIPVSVGNAGCDVSLFVETKIAAAIACCLKAMEMKGEKPEKPFILYSVDFSGIQSFIYTITSSGALKSLRARSLYLSLMMEYVADLILERNGLSRANLIYAGGGRAHILLPSDEETIEKTTAVVQMVNRFLSKNFGAALYLASGYVQTDGLAFTSNQGKDDSFAKLFAETSRQISAQKLCRYSYDELVELNNGESANHDRECAVCGNVRRLVRRNDRDLCITCAQLEGFSSSLNQSPDMLCVVDGIAENGLPLPAENGGECSLVPGNELLAMKSKWTYLINHSADIPKAKRIWMSLHQAKMDSRPATFENLAEKSKGIRRLGVLRADVDNLGMLFAAGFIDKTKKLPYAGCTLTKYSTLSASLTWFFQRHLDDVIEYTAGIKQLDVQNRGNGVSVVYAGGDDVFLIGGWNDVLSAGMTVRDAFNSYTGGQVTMSAGYAVFGEHTPVPYMAEWTADLEETAKCLDGKNGISLFEADERNGYHWDFFKKSVVLEKLDLLETMFDMLPDKGNSFLYHVLMLFREMETRPTAISSLAYLLARHMPEKKDGATDEQIDAYKKFEKSIYQWAIWSKTENAQDERKLESNAFQISCMIYVYLHRQRNEERDGNGNQ